MNLILQAIKSLFRKLENKIDKDIVSNRSDWEQNDENGAGYVKNRPFYCKKDAQIDILPVGNYQTVDMDGAMSYVFEGQLIEGVSYIVTFNDITETRLAVKDSKGNIALEESNNTRLVVSNYDDLRIEFFSWNTHETQVYRLGLVGIMDEIKQIDEKYIPDSFIQTLNNTIDEEVQTVVNTSLNLKMDVNNPIGTGSFSMNRSSGTDIGTCSHAEGYSTTATGSYSHTEGYMTTATGSCAHAEGHKTHARAIGSHAEGTINNAHGEYSHVEGYNNITYGFASHAEGRGTVSSTRSQNILGEYNIIDDSIKDVSTQFESSASRYPSVRFSKSSTYYLANEYSFDKTQDTYVLVNPISISATELKNNFAQYKGYYVIVRIANSANPFGSGIIDFVDNLKYGKFMCRLDGSVIEYTEYRIVGTVTGYQAISLRDTRSAHAHIIGNGTSDVSRSNAYTLDWEGNAWYSGDVYVGSTSGTNKDEGSKKLATEDKITELAIPLPPTATIGQTLCISEVDVNGKVTAVEAVDTQSSNLTLTDETTGKKYKLTVSDGNLTMTEVES